ncbi:MAG: TetR/AcrR family transcriptional regulator [Desulfobacteraceae bacterium]|nr:TetR/AcrR family transcriptional regulator [Desulfobacteraceae bacterium]
MARPARPKKEVYQVKEKILNTALAILIDGGYVNLSMAKIGKQMGMTAANIVESSGI